MKGSRIIAALLVAILFLSGCGDGNWSWESGLNFKPHPGYEWVRPNTLSFATRWVPGKREPQFANIFASEREGYWTADPGYGFVNSQTLSVNWIPNTNHPSKPIISSKEERLWIPKPGHEWTTTDPKVCFFGCPDDYATYPRDLDSPIGLAVTGWMPGSKSKLLSNMYAAQSEGYWNAEAGYTFPDPKVLKVEWTPGVKHPERPHRVAATKEREWALEPGYATVPGVLYGEVDKWSPGLVHPEQRCLRAAAEERVWEPLSGYRLDRAADGSIRIAQISVERDWTRVVVSGLTALAGHYHSQAQSDDGALAAAIGRPLAREIRSAGVKALAQSLATPKPGECNGIVLPSKWQPRSSLQ